MAVAQTAGIQSQAGQGPRAPGATPNAQPGRAATAPGSAGQNQQAEIGAGGARIAVATPQERALVPVSAAENADVDTNGKAFGVRIARLPVELDVSIPLRDFRVRNLLSLEPGTLIESEWSNGVDLPLAAGAVLLAWSEFEVIETELVVRLTRLA
jgi:flagellar motor switch/type III secretory pathway protein FliN